MIKILSILIVAWTAGIASARLSSAADLSELRHLGIILFEGEIKEGDYERLLNFILEKGDSHRTVFLASKGGDAAEAMKIGYLIRALNYETETAKTLPQANYCYKPIRQENCTCLSACPFIYLAGVRRYGDALGVHRVYLNHDALKRLSLEESKRLSKSLETATERYLEEMGAPRSFSEKLQSAASDNIVLLDPKYVEANLYGYIKGYDEYLIAKCGSSNVAFKEMTRERSSEKLVSIIGCMKDEMSYETQRKFKDAIDVAIEKANPKYIQPQSLLAYLKGNTVQDLADLLGKHSSDAMKFLALYGIGEGYQTKGFKFIDETYVLKDSIRVSFDAEGVLSRIELDFFKKNDGTRPYKGSFITGVSTSAEPKTFISVFGEPIDSGCVPDTGICMLYFDNNRFSANVGFEADRRTPRFILLSKSGYWRGVVNKK